MPHAKDQSSEENKYQAFLKPWINSRSQDANTDVKGNENHLTELVFDEYDQRSVKETEVFVCGQRKKKKKKNPRHSLDVNLAP